VNIKSQFHQKKGRKPNIIKYKEKVSDNELNEAINEEHVQAMEA
jgi:hypothetical protein